MFADNPVFVAHTYQNSQKIITLFAQAVKAFGKKINSKAAEDVDQSTPGFHDEDVENQELTWFLSLNTSAQPSATITNLIMSTRPGLPTSQRLSDNSKPVYVKTNCSVYKATVLLTFHYGS